MSLTHRSIGGILRETGIHNQRLEFLGDRVLGLIVADLLFHASAEATEGQLAERQAVLTSRASIVGIAQSIHLDRYIRSSGGASEALQSLDSTLEDACEALIGALYVDGGLPAARRFIEHYWMPLIERPHQGKDAKSALQEWAQGRGLGLPIYEIVAQDGPPHAPHFTIRAQVGDHSASGDGSPKKIAEQAAAAKLLQQIGAP